MCTVSMVGDYWKDRVPDVHPWTVPFIEDPYKPLPKYPNHPGSVGPFGSTPTITSPTRQEFEELKKEMQELKELLKAAQKFDEATAQPHCEHEDKVAMIKKFAEFVGVDLEDVLK